ncbi:uncharacterized protein LOC135345216 isoform X2 [Halichondria panicea]
MDDPMCACCTYLEVSNRSCTPCWRTAVTLQHGCQSLDIMECLLVRNNAPAVYTWSGLLVSLNAVSRIVSTALKLSSPVANRVSSRSCTPCWRTPVPLQHGCQSLDIMEEMYMKVFWNNAPAVYVIRAACFFSPVSRIVSNFPLLWRADE